MIRERFADTIAQSFGLNSLTVEPGTCGDLANEYGIPEIVNDIPDNKEDLISLANTMEINTDYKPPSFFDFIFKSHMRFDAIMPSFAFGGISSICFLLCVGILSHTMDLPFMFNFLSTCLFTCGFYLFFVIYFYKQYKVNPT